MNLAGHNGRERLMNPSTVYRLDLSKDDFAEAIRF
jgi:hypothetical protein